MGCHGDALWRTLTTGIDCGLIECQNRTAPAEGYTIDVAQTHAAIMAQGTAIADTLQGIERGMNDTFTHRVWTPSDDTLVLESRTLLPQLQVETAITDIQVSAEPFGADADFLRAKGTVERRRASQGTCRRMHAQAHALGVKQNCMHGLCERKGIHT